MITEKKNNSGSFILACLCSFLLLTPLVWMLLTSLKPTAEVLLFPPNWFPREYHFHNYIDTWRAAPFGRFYINSIYTGVVTTLMQIFFSLLMAYAFTFVPVKGSSLLFALVLATMVIPMEMKLIPNYILLAKMRWINSYRALIIPPAAHAFPVFVIYQSFRSFPKSLIEASRCDGAGHIRILFQVILPIARPMLAALFLVSFVGRWNDYVWPLIVTSKASMRTLPVGLAYLKEIEGAGGSWNLIMAASCFVIFPILVLFTFTQKQFVSGLTTGAIKG